MYRLGLQTIRFAVCGLVLLVMFAAAPVHAAPGAPRIESGPPTDHACLPLVFGTTGVLGVDDQAPPLAAVTGQGTWGAPAPAALKLPSRILLKDTRNTVSANHALALRGGRLFARRATHGVPDKGSIWREVNLPECLRGKLTGISADRNLLLAVGPGGQVYSHSMPGGDLNPGRWTWRWGPYLWMGSGARLPSDLVRFATSDLSKPDTFTDSAGRRHQPIGVATLFLLLDQGRRITYLDPWLPTDSSREVCLPNAGTSQLAGMDATGSTLLVATRSGELFTRMYDFDLTGANAVLGKYTWRTGRPADPASWQLPIPDWKRQPTPPGTFTDRVAIVSTGLDARDRELRVEGRNAGGPGVWVKRIAAPQWRLVRTGGALPGRPLPASSTPITRPARRYLGTMGGATAEIAAFDWACTPTEVRVTVGRGAELTLLLHAYDGMRQSPRPRGLTDDPRECNAALEVPKATWDRLDQADPRVRAWVRVNLTGRFTVNPVSVTATRLRFRGTCWNLTLNGKPARPDDVSQFDLGETVEHGIRNRPC